MRASPATAFVCVCALVSAALAGCSPLPQTGRESVATKAAPQLLPIDQLLAAAADAPGGASAAQGNALAARAARLRARAGLMRGPVMEPETRARLDAAILAGKA
jgi:hypothetical protein